MMTVKFDAVQFLEGTWAEEACEIRLEAIRKWASRANLDVENTKLGSCEEVFRISQLLFNGEEVVEIG